MKILHCADLHLDSKMESHLEPEKAKLRKAELLANFDRMVTYAFSEGVKAILIAGDLFDTSKISKTAKDTVLGVIEKNSAIDFYYLRGNHDHDDFLAGVEVPENLHLFSDSWTIYEDGPVRIAGVEFTETNHHQIYGDLQLSEDKFNIVMLHGQKSRSDSKDKTEIIHLEALKNHHIHYLALGHVHKYQRERLEGHTDLCYPGCLEGRGFDEMGAHGFMLLDIHGIGDADIRFVPFANREFSEVSVDITGLSDGREIYQKTLQVLEELSLSSKDCLRVILTGTVSESFNYDETVLLRLLESRYFLVQVKKKVQIQVDFKRYEHDDSLEGAFVRSVKADPELSEEDRGEIIRLGLETFFKVGGKA